VTWLGWWGALAAPLLIPLVWLVEAIALGVSRLIGAVAKSPQRLPLRRSSSEARAGKSASYRVSREGALSSNAFQSALPVSSNPNEASTAATISVWSSSR
jgi:hypothetical protein